MVYDVKNIYYTLKLTGEIGSNHGQLIKVDEACVWSRDRNNIIKAIELGELKGFFFFSTADTEHFIFITQFLDIMVFERDDGLSPEEEE